MLTLEEIKERLSDRNISAVAKNIGMTRQFISAVKTGRAPNPSYDTVKKLSDYLEGGNGNNK